MAAGDVFPRRNLPPQSEDWGRKVEERLIAAERSLDGTKTSVSNANRAGTLALDATAAQGSQIVEVKDQTTQTQQEISLDQMTDPGNLFDYAPIIAKDPSLFWTARQPTPGTAYYEPAGVPNIVEWFPDGFTVESTEPGLLAIGNRRPYNMGPEVRYNTRFSAAFTPTSNPWPNTVYARLGLWVGPYSWPAVDGPIGTDQPQIGSFSATPNPGADGEYYYPDVTRAVSTFPGDPDRTTWRPAITLNFTAAGQRFTIRKIRMQVIAGTLDFTGGATIPEVAIPDDRIIRRMIAPGAVGPDELGSDVVMGVADNSLTTAKYQNLSVTDAKIDDLSATKLTGTIDQARIPTLPVDTKTSGNLPTTRLSGTLSNSQYADLSVSLTKVDSTVRSRLSMSGLFDYSNPFRGANTYVETVGNITWWAVAIPVTGYAGITVENTLNDGSPAFYNGRLYAPVAGKYFMTATAAFSNSSGGSARAIAFQIGSSATGNRKGQSVSRYSPMPNSDLWANSSAIIKANAGDMLSVVVRQDSGGNLSCAIESLQVVYLGPA